MNRTETFSIRLAQHWFELFIKLKMHLFKKKPVIENVEQSHGHLQSNLVNGKGVWFHQYMARILFLNRLARNY